MSDAQILVAVIVALLALAGTVGSALLGARQKGLVDLATQLQDRLDKVEARVQQLESRDRAWANYVHVLRRHINDRLGPPPPEYPANLDV